MDFLLDTYLWPYVPFEIEYETRKTIGEKAVTLVQYADWVCKYQDPRKIFDNHTSFLFGELMFYVLCILTFVHAYRHGGRYMYVWIGIFIHAVNVESLSFWIPDMNTFWHAQSVLTLFGMRFPLYLMLGTYHHFLYCGYVMTQKLRLPWWAEGPVTGLCVVMLDIPYDIMGVKLLWWTWHDTDPNISDRMYWVPLNSYFFHASFACSFVWITNLTRHFFVDKEYDWRKFHKEFLCVFFAGMGAFWVGIAQFVLIYQVLHDFYQVPTEVITMFYLGSYLIVMWIADRNNKSEGCRKNDKWWFDEVPLAICLEYLFFMVVVCIADPLNIVAEGLHQPIGPCGAMDIVKTPIGTVLERRKYLCPSNYNEEYIDFHCVPNGAPKQQDERPLEWYAMCGTDFENRAEYVSLIWGSSILFLTIFYQMAACSGVLPEIPVKRLRSRAGLSTPRTSKFIGESISPTKFSTFFNPRPIVQQEEQDGEDLVFEDDANEASAPSSPDVVSPTITRRALRSLPTRAPASDMEPPITTRRRTKPVKFSE